MRCGRNRLSDLGRRARACLNLLMAGALLLQGCSNYKTTLQYPSGQSARTANVVVAPGGDPRFVLPQGLTLDEKAVLVLPRPAQDETVVSGDPKISYQASKLLTRL